MADINKLVEQFAAGIKSSVREDVTTGDLEGFKDFSLSAKPKTSRRNTPRAAFVSPKDIDPAGDMCAKDTLARGKSPRRPKAVSPVATPVEEKDDNGAAWPPPGYVSPVVYRCGHTNRKGDGVTEDDPKQIAAREAGHCCEAHRKASVKADNAEWKRPANIRVEWRVRGLWDPVPHNLRRTPEKEQSQGFPGLCCDPKTGLYIGGLGNCCHYYNKASKRCAAHAPKVRQQGT